MDENLQRWIVEAHEDERMDAIIEFEGSVDVGDIRDILDVHGVVISGAVDVGGTVVNASPSSLRGIINEGRVASVVQPPPGTGIPGAGDLQDSASFVQPPPGTGEPGHPGADLED